MSEAEEQIEFPLDDTAVKPEPNKEEPVLEIVDASAPAEADKSEPQNVEKALKKLSKKLEKEKEARREAESQARQAAEQARKASMEVQDSRIHLVGGAIETLKRDDDILTAHLRNAMEVGDYDKAAEINRTLATNASKLSELERGYNDLRNAPPPPPVQQAPREMSVDDVIQQVTPRSAEWLRANKQHLPDSRSLRIMGRAHDDAVDLGIIPESDQYFRFIESRVGIGPKPSSYESDDAMSGAAKVTKNRQSPPSAPVSRQPVDTPNRPGTIRLTAEQVEAAKISGVTPQEYYKLMMQERNRN
jgi:hypothetical protein